MIAKSLLLAVGVFLALAGLLLFALDGVVWRQESFHPWPEHWAPTWQVREEHPWAFLGFGVVLTLYANHLFAEKKEK